MANGECIRVWADNLKGGKGVNILRDEWKKLTMGRLFVQRTTRTRQQQAIQSRSVGMCCVSYSRSDLDPEAHNLREVSRPCQVERIYVVENIVTVEPTKEKQSTVCNNGNVIATR